ncbi:MAG: DNA topoisomerase IB [Chloroflexota bacterium]|nr:DNA topoisomerase IB [Chloroflexota bacterium]
MPGITRLRRKGANGRPAFSYRSASGRPVRDEATLARIRSLAIPPAYEDVWICPHPRGHLQATGRDARGRKQYRYHPDWRAGNDRAKHGRMAEFGRALPTLRRALRADLRKPGLPREKVLALVLSLMDQTCARIGNAEYARTNGSFGLSTLQDRHARFFRNGTGTLRFPGKSGTLHDVPIGDPRLATLVRKCQELPGQHLFQYVDEEGHRRSVDSGQVNAYLREHLGNGFSAKDFRTWHATRLAYELLLRVERPEPCTDAACRRVLKAIVCEVAAQLRNTPAVCRKSYINPVVLEAWQAGKGPFAAGRSARSGLGSSRGGVAPLLTLLRSRQ